MAASSSRFSIEAIFRAVDRITIPLKKMGLNTKRFTLALRKDFLKAQRAVSRFANNMKTRFVALGRNILRFGALAAAAVVVGFVVGIAKIAKEGDKLAKTSRQIGLTAEELQAMRFAADRQGVSAEALTKSLEKLLRNVGDLRAGTGMLTTFLNKTDPAFSKQLKNVNTNQEAFDLIVKQMAKLPTQFDKAALAQAAFGRAGIDMLKLLEAGPEGIMALRKEAQKYGLITNETAAQSEKFVDQLTNLKAAAKGVFISLASDFIPTVTELIEKIKDWIGENKELIKTKVQDFIKKAGDFTRDFIGFIKKAKEIIEPLVPVIKGLAIAFAIYKVAMIAAAVATGIFNAVLAINPIFLVITAIALLVMGIIWLVKNWDKVVVAMKKAWHFIATNFITGIKYAGKQFAKFGEKIKSVWQSVKDFILKIWEKIKMPFEAVGNFLGIDKESREARQQSREEFDTDKMRAARGVVTTRQSISETTNRSEITVTNQGETTVETDSGSIRPGGSIILAPSG